MPITLYIATAPCGRSYIGTTSTSIKQRWQRQGWVVKHRTKNSLLCAELRVTKAADWTLRALAVIEAEVRYQTEDAAIVALKTLAPDGFNMTLNLTPSAAVIAKRAAGNRGQRRTWQQRVMFIKRGIGRHVVSDAGKAAVSKAQTGRIHTPAEKQKRNESMITFNRFARRRRGCAYWPE